MMGKLNWDKANKTRDKETGGTYVDPKPNLYPNMRKIVQELRIKSANRTKKLTLWEELFLESMLEIALRGRKLTNKQLDILLNIMTKFNVGKEL